MKMLYVGPNIEKVHTGGDSVNKRNLDLLKAVFNDDLSIYLIESPLNTVFQKIKGYLGGITPDIIRDILSLIKNNNIEYVFLSQSFFGKLCRAIKIEYSNVKVITFYHNIEKYYAEEFVRVSGFTHYPFYLLASYNEKLTIQYSDYNFVLNDRDANLMKIIYGIESDFSLPVSYKDIFDESKIKFKTNNPLKILFVGTAFFGNLSGIEFFINEVMPYIDAELIIVGKGMDQYKKKFEAKNNVKVLGFVDDLSELYYDSSIVVAPIFSGGGMKTKIAEALMYGKIIIGTKEALEGYLRQPNVTLECNNAKEFISCISKLNGVKNLQPFNNQARKLFMLNYDNDVLLIRLKNFFNTKIN